MKNAKLIDSNGMVIAQFTNNHTYEHCIQGIVTEVVSWSGKDFKEMSDERFFADISMKWDGCSHLWFNGEDYYGKDEDKDSYYHICGVRNLLNHMRILHFCYELMASNISSWDKSERGEYDKIKNLGLLDGCTIEYFDEQISWLAGDIIESSKKKP